MSKVAAALITLALGGCAAPVRPAWLKPDVPVVPPDLIVTADDGARLPTRVWRPANGAPRAVVLALHGFTDSRDAWEGAGPFFARSGIALYAYDQRGFGAAPGRGHWAGTPRMLRDAAEVAAFVAAREPGVPLYVMGESMGGAEVMCLAAGDELAGAHVAPAGFVLLAPALWGRGQMSPLYVASLDIADAVAPGWSLTGSEVNLHIRASDDRAALIRLVRDPLTLHGSKVSMLSGLVDLMTQAQAAAPHVRGHVLIAYGAKDDLVPAPAMAAAWRKLPAEVRRAYYANGFHLMMRDLDRRAVEDDVASWIANPGYPLPSGADVLAAAWVASRSWDALPPEPLPAAFPVTPASAHDPGDRQSQDDPR